MLSHITLLRQHRNAALVLGAFAWLIAYSEYVTFWKSVVAGLATGSTVMLLGLAEFCWKRRRGDGGY